MDYQQTFNDTYNQAKPEEYGNAGLTSIEIRAIRHYIREYEEFDTDMSLRDFVMRCVVNEGWQVGRSVRPESLGLSAVRHGCVVAEALVQERLEEDPVNSPRKTFESYIIKNQAYRYIQSVLQRSGTFKWDPYLKDKWFAPQERTQGHKNDRVRYPDNVDSTKIYGISKPDIYMAVQLMKEVETRRMYAETPGDVYKYAIDWREFDEAITTSNSVSGITANIAKKVIDIFLERDFDISEIAEIVLGGLSPSGPVKEHGPVNSVFSVWGKLILKLRIASIEDDRYSKLSAKLNIEAQKKLDAAIDFLNNQQGNSYERKAIS
jgi:hypothetical protein